MGGFLDKVKEEAERLMNDARDSANSIIDTANREAGRINNQAQEALNVANRESERIINQAQETIKKAEAQANAILDKAETEAQRIEAQANETLSKAEETISQKVKEIEADLKKSYSGTFSFFYDKLISELSNMGFLYKLFATLLKSLKKNIIK